MSTSSNASQVDLEVVLTAVTIALMASHPGFDTHRFSAILAAASLPEAGLSAAAVDILQRLAASTAEWADQREPAGDEGTSVVYH